MAHYKGAFKIDREKFYRIHLGTGESRRLARLKLWVVHFGLHCVAVYRFGQWARDLKRRWPISGRPVFWAHRIMNYLMRLIHHVDIDDADIQPGFYIGHVGTIFVGPSRVGRNFSLHHNVTVGIGHARTAEGVPTIGDNVWIGAGAIVAGAISIGHNATIANGCMLTRNVPDGCLAGGNPGRVLLQNYDNAELLGIPAGERAGGGNPEVPSGEA